MIEYAKRELDLIVGECKDENSKNIQERINRDILSLVEVFASQGHTGFTANYTLNILKRLLAFKPIKPLTGEENEWKDVELWGKERKLQQNKRFGAVFRENFDNSTAYYSEGKVFSDDGGESWYVSKDSRVPVKFPFEVPNEPERIILNSENINKLIDNMMERGRDYTRNNEPYKSTIEERNGFISGIAWAVRKLVKLNLLKY